MRKTFSLLLASLPLTAFAVEPETATPPPPAPPPPRAVETPPPPPSPVAATETSAPDWEHEFSGDASTTFGTLSDLSMKDRHYSFYGSGGYDYALSSAWQIGGRLGFLLGKTDNSRYGGGSLLVGPTLNFTGREGLKNAVFVSLKAGMTYYRQSGNSESAFMGDISVGKRWAITSTVSYKPYVGATVTKYSNDSSLNLNIVPLSFSFGF